MAVNGGKIFTHPDGNLILPGITKRAVIDLCQKLNVPVIEKPVTETSLTDVEELMIVGTGNEILPVTKVNDQLIGDGRPGPVTRKLQSAFFDITYRKMGGEKRYWFEEK